MTTRRELLAQWFPGARIRRGRFGLAADVDDRHRFSALAFAHRNDIRGFIDEHVAPDGRWHACSCWFPTAPVGVNAWTVEADSPLTLSPSLVCPFDGCGDHGFIRGGTWVPV